MADDKDGRESQARDAERRQREREMAADLERGDEADPPIDAEAVEDVTAALEALAFPATGGDIVGTVGDRTVDSPVGTYTVAELVPESDAATFDTPDAVHQRVRRPTVASAMKRVVEATERHQGVDFGTSQRSAYERTFRELGGVDALDDDEVIGAVADWAVGRIHETEALPGSRALRRQAATVARANGREVRNDEWLGV